ncbi:hypothetical protein DKX38_018806 [Salix brachista]|uniref:SAP domain-containing protein n=1 Tax=Salix brachista TaxID=2182728 RepID=A0A5N5KPU8_9ROSI|nr:hypothetical protein DKX38_018806 [Salix brachista]
METSSSHPSDSNPKAAGASRFLANLPSRGFLSSAVSSSNPGGMRVYICEHDTSPPEGQQIKTNQTNILIRSLQLNKQKGDSSSKDVKGVAASEGSRKREAFMLQFRPIRLKGAEKALNSRASAKRGNNQIGSLQDESDTLTSDKEYYSLTVERLRALLKERGLSPKGKKASIQLIYIYLVWTSLLSSHMDVGYLNTHSICYLSSVAQMDRF